MKKSRVFRASALIVGLSFVGVACGGSDSSSDTTTASSSSEAYVSPACDSPVAAIGWQGVETGDYANLGAPMIKGAQLAIDEYNTANPEACVVLKKFDTQGDPAKAPAAAQAAIDDATVLGLIGPGFSGETNAAAPLYEKAGLGFVTGSATNAKLQTNGWTVYHRLLANDDKQGPAIANYLVAEGAKSVAVIDDGSDYGKGLAGSVATTLGAVATVTDTIDPKAADFSAAVSKVKDAAPEYVFYGGYYGEAAKLATQLKDAGVTAVFVSGDGVKDQAGFADAAGPAAEGALIGCPCKDGSEEFIANWNKAYGETPGTYGAEYYDAANVVLAAIKGGATDRAAVLAAIKAYDAPGITKNIKFGEDGDATEGNIYIYKVVDGKLTYLAEAK
jgi:branched-chain amino acid transport system substrate-binding protein